MNNQQNPKQANEKPFFARFLECQISDEAAASIQGAGDQITYKYPSDTDNITVPASADTFVPGTGG
jgi:hypothetical protein